MLNKNRIKTIVIFLVLLNFGSVLNLFLPFNLLDVLTIVLCFVGFSMNRVKMSNRLIAITGIIFLTILISSIFTNTSLLLYKAVFLKIIIADLVLTLFSYNMYDIKKCFYKCCQIISILGLVNFILYMLFPVLFTFKISPDGYFVNTFGYIFNYYQTTFGITRNQGIYWEPGVFQIVLNLHLFHILVENRESFKKAILPIFLIISTISTTGYVIMALLIGYRMIFMNNIKRNILRSCVLFSALVVVFTPLLQYNLQNKLNGEDAESAALRFYDYKMGLKTIRENPILGIGFDMEKYKKQSNFLDLGMYDVVDIDRGNTNTIICMFVFWGIPIGILFLYALYKQRIFKKKKILFFILLIALSSEPLFPLTLTCIILLSSLKYGVERNVLSEIIC